MARKGRSRLRNVAPAGKVATAALLDVDGLEPPSWADVDQQVAAAGLWQTLRALPAAVALVARLAFSVAPRLTVVAGVVQLGSGCASAFGLYSTANVFTSLLAAGPTPQRLLASLPAVVLVVVSFGLRGLLNAAVEAVRGRLTPWVRHAAHAEVATALAGVDLIAWEDADFRELARQGGQRGAVSVETSLRGIAEIASACVSLAAALITAGMLDLWLVPVLLLSSVADAVVSMWIAKLGYRHFLAMVARNMRLHVVENLLVARDVAVERHALALQRPLLREQHRISADLAQETIQLERRKTSVRVLGQVLSAAGTGMSYVVLAVLLYVGVMPLAIAGAAVVAMRTASSALSSTMTSANRLYEDSFYLHFYRELIRQARQKHPQPSTVVAPRFPQTIRLEDVWFTYPGQPEPALREITLTLRCGEVVALVGQNGSGKSTLGKLITGLYLPTQGAVCWDGVDLATVDRNSVHDRIAVIAQEPARWPMTAAVNVRIGRLEHHDPDQRVWQEALSASGADEVLHSLPRGEDTVLSRQFKEGVDLSGGQWQRLAVARGGFRDAPVLLADEPTAALDAMAEARVFAGLRRAARNTDASRHDDSPRRTVILVTHRLANVRSADRIIVLDRGRIIESGTHDELMAADTHYRKLFDIQADPYRADAPVLGVPDF